MAVLITGVAGFIGSSLAKQMVAEGIDVIGLDNFDSFYSKEIKLSNLRILMNDRFFTFFQVDLRNAPEMWLKNFNNFTIDVVVHLSAISGVAHSMRNPLAYFTNNILGTKAVLNLMEKIGCTKLVFASSSSVYGNLLNNRYAHEMMLPEPLTPYGESKVIGEQICEQYCINAGFDIIVCRLFSVYGPHQRPDLFIRKAASLIMCDKPVTIFGDGSSERDYTFITDIVDGLISAAKYVQTDKGFEVVNLGSSKPVKLMHVVDDLYEIFQKVPNIIHLPPNDFEVIRTSANINRAHKILNFLPKTNFHDGLREFTNWMSHKNPLPL